MSSLLSIGVSVLVFVIVTGFMWFIGSNVLAHLYASIPALDPANAWAGTVADTERLIQNIFLWTPGILFLFICIKVLSSSAGVGRD